MPLGIVHRTIETYASCKILGWAYAEDVLPKESYKYVFLFQYDGERWWFHGGSQFFEKLVRMTQENSKKLAHV